MSRKALVFLSCGQRNGERELAAEIEKIIKSDEIGLACYNAESRQGFDDVMSIAEHLSKADYYLFIDFKRDDGIPVSIFSHQEFALARAWGITEMLAFREKGAPEKGNGMIGYVLAHPITFERENLVSLVMDNIRKKGWSAGYSRNLIASKLIVPNTAFTITDDEGTFNEKVWKVIIRNRRCDKAALNTIAILDKVIDSQNNSQRPDTTYLKWSGLKTHQRAIFPEDEAELDAFCTRSGKVGIFLHSLRDIYPREPIISQRGNYILDFLLYADTFTVSHFQIELTYTGEPDGIEAKFLYYKP